MLIICLSFQVYAATETIEFGRDTVKSYDIKLTDQSLSCVTKSETISIKTVYIKTIENDDVQFKSTLRLTTSNYGFLNQASTVTLISTTAKQPKDLAGISVTANDLIVKGLSADSFASTYPKFYFIGVRGKNVDNFGILIQVKNASTEPSLTDAQKKPLTDLLATVADGNDKYVQSGDRYNGKPADTITSKNGSFWAEFTAVNGPRAKAEKVLQDAKTEAEITTAVAELKAAISKLIPTSQLNATYLYETLQERNYGDEYLEKFTAPSVQKFRAARSAAQSYLDSLFNADGSAKEGVNIAANQQTADDYADALKNSGLVSKDSVEESKVNLRTIQALAKRYAMTENDGKYTDESWTAFENARKAAVDYAANHQVSENMSSDDTKQYASRTRAFLSAAYGLTPAPEEITVTFSYTDDLHLRLPGLADTYGHMKDPAGNIPQLQTVTLPSGSTLADLLTRTGYSTKYAHINEEVYSVWHTFVNGTMLYGTTPGVSASYADTSYVLKDGDQIQLTHMDWPSYTFNYIYKEGVDWTNMTDALGMLRFQETGAQSAGAGEAKTLTVERTSAHLWTYSGSYSAFEGASIAAYGPQNEDGSYPAEPIRLDAVSDASGSVSFKLYQEGKYLVTAYDARANDEDAAIFYSGTVAAPYLELTVGDAAQPDAVRAELKAELDAVYNACPRKIFGEDMWNEIVEAYNAALDKINDPSVSIGEAYAAQQTAIQTIQSKQTETIQANKTALDTFRTNLNKLPDDPSKITASESVKAAALTLLQCYSDMNSYQRSLITSAEKAKYDRIKAYMDANGEDLPAAQRYKLTLNVVGDTEEATAALNAMIGNLRDKPAKMDRAEGGKYDHTKAIEIVTPYTFGAYDSRSMLFSETFAEADSLTPVRIYTNVDYAAYFQTRNAGGTFTADGAAWSISDEDLGILLTLEGSGSTPGEYTIEDHLTVTIGGVEYEVKSIRYDGISKADVISGTQRVYDDSGYKGKANDVVNVDVPDAYLGFAMPYNDVTVTITWGPAAGSADKLTKAKETAASVLQEKYDSLDKTLYDEEGKAALDAALNAGLTAISSATTEAEVNSARRKAVAALESVPTMGQSFEMGEVGESFTELYPDAEAVGRVHVIVENTMYLDEDLPNDLKNVFIDGYYELTDCDSMMSVVLKALEGAGYTWNNSTYDYSTTYISSIEKDGSKLAEFTGGPNSGWMGTKNDWFVNASFSEFRYSNGTLEDGDELRVMYTTKLGADLGGSWSSTDTSLEDLTVIGGMELAPAFSGATTSYVLTIPKEKTGVTVRFSAANKNYQARMYLNSYKDENSRYMSGELLSVSSGDVIYIGVGERTWPSMNDTGTPTVYTIQIVKSGDVGDVAAVVDALPPVKRLTRDDAKDVYMAMSLFNSLGEEDQERFKTEYPALYEKLIACEKIIGDMAAADAVAAAAEKLPELNRLTLEDKAAVYSAKAALDALTADQMQYLTMGAIAAINDANARMLQLEREYVQELIDGLPDKDAVSLADRKQIEAARAAYEALTPEQKAEIQNLNKLIDAEEALKKLGRPIVSYVKPTEGVLPVTDVTASDWFYDDVAFAYSEGLFAGTSDTTFSPNAAMTRAMLVTVLYRLEGEPSVSGRSSFPDVQADSYYEDAVIWAASHEIVNGTSTSTFSPDQNVTREQMAAILYRYAQYKGYHTAASAGLDSFSDHAGVSGYAVAPLQWTVAEKLIGGSDGALMPTSNATRAQVAAILHRFVENVAKTAE